MGFVRHTRASSGIQVCMPDEARDRRNVALKFLNDCWRARSSKAEFLHVYTMSYIFVNLPDKVRCNVRQGVHFLTCVNVQLFSLYILQVLCCGCFEE